MDFFVVASVVCCHVVSATSRSLVQRTPTECRVSMCVWSRKLKNEEAMAHVGQQRHRKDSTVLIRQQILYIVKSTITIIKTVLIKLLCLNREARDRWTAMRDFRFPTRYKWCIRPYGTVGSIDSFWIAWNLTIRSICCPETSVKFYQSTLREILKHRKSQWVKLFLPVFLNLLKLSGFFTFHQV